MKLAFLVKTGLGLMSLSILWICFCSGYGMVKVYNLTEKKKYRYLGILWIERKAGEFYLKIPLKMIKKSFTTQYKIIPEHFFKKEKDGKRIRINFAGQRDVTVEISDTITVKNYIATSNQL